MTIREAQQLFERMEEQVDTAAEQGFQRVIDRGLSLARKQTSGRRSPSELRRRDHPYATRHGSPLLDPAKVNSQSGGLLSRWYATRQRGGGGSVRELRGAVVNDDPVTEYLEGTTIMFPRPVAAAVEKKLEAEAESILGKAISRVLSRYAT